MTLVSILLFVKRTGGWVRFLFCKSSSQSFAGSFLGVFCCFLTSGVSAVRAEGFFSNVMKKGRQPRVERSSLVRGAM